MAIRIVNIPTSSEVSPLPHRILCYSIFHFLGEYSFISRNADNYSAYGSASEVVRTGLRILKLEKEKSPLIKSLIKGDKSKRVENFDPKAFT